GGPPQTNGVGRAAALLGGLRHLAAEACLPVRLVEIGASAGLNLRADRFHVHGPAGRYGDPASPVVLDGAWRGRPPPGVPFEVIGRTGGGRAPLDPAAHQGRAAPAPHLWARPARRPGQLRGAPARAPPRPPPPRPG